MEFIKFRELFKKNIKRLVEEEGVTNLFETNIDKDKLWEIYLSSFPQGTNNIFRERSFHDCSCCRYFIKTFGGLVYIKDNKIKSIWEFDTESSTYQPVIDAIVKYVKINQVTDMFVTTNSKFGVDTNYENTENGVLEHSHFSIELPKCLVYSGRETEGSVKGDIKTNKEVFQSSLEKISIDSVESVLDLIKQNSLYKGNEWESVLEKFLTYIKNYNNAEDKELFAWDNSIKAGTVISKIKNHSIGLLLTDITEGMDLDTAVTRYEKVTAPENYKRPKAIFTQKMLDEAKSKIETLGYLDSLGRRHATLEDIRINNILFCNRESAKSIKGGDIFDEMSSEVKSNPKKFNKVEEISIENFITNVLPTLTTIEAYVEGTHTNNFMSLIAPKIVQSKTMFKWNNNFSWSYKGNITDSSMKQNVKDAGGKIDGVLRCSLQWNDIAVNENDLDLHCYEPEGNHIYFGNDINYKTTGTLDVDIREPLPNKPAVENITWSNRNNMELGNYIFSVENYQERGGRGGFRAEIEFDGEIYSYEYLNKMRDFETIELAEVYFDGNKFTIKHFLEPISSCSKEVWGITTNKFVPVSIIMNSPNYWDLQQGIGNKHYMFILRDCVNNETPNGFYNEFLKQELVEHKRVFEALGSKMRVEESDKQLSGIGFSSTKRAELIVKVTGATTRLLKIKF